MPHALICQGAYRSIDDRLIDLRSKPLHHGDGGRLRTRDRECGRGGSEQGRGESKWGNGEGSDRGRGQI